MSILRRDRTPARVRLLAADESERVPETGAVASVQEAEVLLPGAMLETLWRPEYLERLARAYWLHINRATLGFVRIVYGEDFRAAVLLSRHLPLLRFHAPEYETSPERGVVTWPIDRGLLVAREGRANGFLRIAVSRCDPVAGANGTGLVAGGAERGDAGTMARLNVRLEVRNFYPWLRGGGRFARLGAWFYAQTQLRIHVLVCNAFLRSLARLDLPPSRVGALAGEIAAPGAEEPFGAPADG